MTEIVNGEVVQKPATPPPEPEIETHPEPEYTEMEQQAMTQGWKPKDQWEGNPEEHRSAREFLDRGELLTKIKSQSQELRQVQAIVANLSEHNKKVYLAGYQGALRELQQKKVAALEERNSVAVVTLDEQISQAKDNIRAIQNTPALPAQPASTTITPEFRSFMDRNPWYKDEATKRHWAHGMALEYAKDHPRASEADVYEYIEKEYKGSFPGAAKNKLPPSPDGDGRQSSSGNSGRNASSGAFEKLLARLPEEHARVAKEMVKRGVVTKESYVKDYELLEGNR